MGRRTKLTPDVEQRIVEAVRAGNYLSAAAEYGGISADTLNDWIRRGEGTHPNRAAHPIYVRFVQALKKARADAEVWHVANIRRAANQEWTASAWWLERSFPDRWGRRVHEQRLAGPDGGPVNVTWNVRLLSDQELIQLRNLAERAALPASDNGAGA